jgi:catechol 2,3-dioxygenase-like lactoylglutathione lyase family enzyme
MRIIAGLLIVGVAVVAQAPERPSVTGIAHVALYVRDLAKARQFYEEFLGFAEPFTLPSANGGVATAFVKINDTQYLELGTGPDRGEGQMNHVAIAVGSAEQMRRYLAGRGIAVPSDITTGKSGNKYLNIKDPDGHVVEIVEYQSDSWTARETGKSMPAARISDRIMHAGFLAGGLGESMAFYGGVLGFKEFWRGSSTPQVLSWVNLRVPDGSDYVELMLYDALPAPGDRGTRNHVALMVQDAPKAPAELRARAARGLYSRPIEMKVGVNRRYQINLFDPDGTRIEVMGADTIDGKPAASSTAPPPRP